MCALRRGGHADRPRGDNENGQPGDGTGIDKGFPTQVKGLESGAVAISSDHWHTCAVTEQGDVNCWGGVAEGLQLGDGSFDGSLVPVQVIGLDEAATSVAAADRFTCALVSGGGVWCWGENEQGNLGDSTFDSAPFP